MVGAHLCLAGTASANTFAANDGSLGAIPDGTSVNPGNYGAPRDVTFTVPSDTFASGSPTHVAVTLTANHSFVGDLDVVLIAPDDTQVTLFSRTGAASAGQFGSNSNLGGTYTFSDLAPSSPTWWEAAGGTPDTRAIPGGSYRASAAGPGTGSNTSLNALFFDNANNMNGMWTLRVRDGTASDTGAITAASLNLLGRVAATPGFLGPIPDGPSAAPGTFGAPLDVLFSVDGMTTVAPTSVSVSMTFSPNHTYVGDLEAKLIAPDNDEATIFSRTGATSAGSPGDDSNLAGPYTFFDGALGSWWTAAANAPGDHDLIAAGSYRPSAPGGAGGTGADNPINAAFAGVQDPNGVWTLRFRDGTLGDTGSVSAASLRLLNGTDSTAPLAPSLGTTTDPPSPSSSSMPKVKGNVDAGTTVRLYANGSCSGLPAATGPAAELTGSVGIPVPIDNDGPGMISATAYDASGNVSLCSNAISYTRDTAAPTTPTLSSTDPASPANNNFPKFQGSTEDLISLDPDVDVKLYESADCSGPVAETGTEAELEGPGIEIEVPEDSTVTLRATATDEAGNVSGCSALITYVEDSSSPTPTLVATDPASPANNNFPKVKGSGAEAGATIKVFSGTDCTGPLLFDGTASAFNGAGVEIEVLDDTSDPYRVNATDTLGNVSGCSNALTYTEDSTAPAAPTLSATDPASPANQNSPNVKGSAEAGSQIALFTTAGCTGPPAGAGTAAQLAGAGIPVSVPGDETTAIRAIATDAAANPSACSAPISYIEDSTAPLTATLSATDPGSGSNQNSPKIKGAAEAGAQVRLFASADCSGSFLATGTAAELGGAGIAISVADNSATQIRGTTTDAAGNASACSSPLAYVEDSNAPTVTITSQPKPKVKTRKKRAPFSIGFSADESATFRCALDDEAPVDCTSPFTGKAKKGAHDVSVIATDSAGNTSGSVIASWKVKRKKPDD